MPRRSTRPGLPSACTAPLLTRPARHVPSTASAGSARTWATTGERSATAGWPCKCTENWATGWARPDFGQLGYCCHQADRYNEAIAFYQQALRVYADVGERYSRAKPSFILAKPTRQRKRGSHPRPLAASPDDPGWPAASRRRAHTRETARSYRPCVMPLRLRDTRPLPRPLRCRARDSVLRAGDQPIDADLPRREAAGPPAASNSGPNWLFCGASPCELKSNVPCRQAPAGSEAAEHLVTVSNRASFDS